MKLFVLLWAATAVWGQAVSTGSWTNGGPATWGSGNVTGGMCGPPGYLCSRIDTTIHPLADPNNAGPKHPPLLAAPGQATSCGGSQCWGGSLGAGVVASDSFYNGNRMLRLTDFQTDPNSSHHGYSFFTDSSAENTQTNWDGTIFAVLEKSNPVLFSFNKSTWQSSACATGSSSCNAAQLQLSGAGAVPGASEFGTTNTVIDGVSDNYALYVFNSNTHHIERWVIAEGTPWTIAIDPNWPTAGASGVNLAASSCLGTMMTPWTQFGNFAVSGNDTRFTAEVRTFNGLQDEGGLIVVYDLNKGCKWLDLRRMATSQDWNNPTETSVTTAGNAGDFKLGPPAAPTATAASGGSLTSGHQYAVQYAYTLRNGTSLGGGDIGESDGSGLTLVSLSTGQGSIALTAPGTPPSASQPPGVTIAPTGYNVYMCDNTASPGCTPTRQTVDQAPAAVTGLTCAAANPGPPNNYSYTYSVVVRTTALSFASTDVGCTVQTQAPVGSGSNAISISWTASTSSGVVYDLYRNGRDTRIYSNTGTSLSDTSVGPASIVAEAVQGTATATTISTLAAGYTVAYTGLQATSGFSTHNVKMDLSGNPMVIDNTAISLNLGFNSPPHFWYTDVNGSASYQIIPCPVNCPGHRVNGYSVQLREPGNTSSLNFIYAAPAETSAVVSAVNDSGCSSTNPNCHFAAHDNWSDAAAGMPYRYPLVSSYAPVTTFGSTTWPNSLYEGELFGLPMCDGRTATCASPNTNGYPVRFGMLYTSGNEGTRFYGTPRCFMAQTGDYAVCSTAWTNWNENADGSPGYGGFGDGNGNETCDPSLNPNVVGTAACRVDVVLFELR